MLATKHPEFAGAQGLLLPFLQAYCRNGYVLQAAIGINRAGKRELLVISISVNQFEIGPDDRQKKLLQLSTGQHLFRCAFQPAQLGDEFIIRQVERRWVRISNMRSGTAGDKQSKR